MPKLKKRTLSTRTSKSLFSTMCEVVERVRRSSDSAMLKKMLPHDQYMREMATIRLDLTRRMGNTTLAKMLFKRYDDSVLVFPNRSMMKQMAREDSRSNGRRMFHAEDILSLKKLMYGYKMVIVDCCTVMKDDTLKAIYDCPTVEALVLLG